MTGWRRGIAAGLLVGVTGCATTQQSAQVGKLSLEVAKLETRIAALEQHQAPQTEASAWSGSSMQELPSVTPSTDATAHVKPTTRRIQQALKNAGFYAGEIDGRMGPKTKQAVKEFQKANELNADGVVGRKTWLRLGTHLTTTASVSSAPAEQ